MTFSEILVLIFGIYYVCINIYGFIIMGVDKRKAIKGAYRISEAALFGAALLGGALGTSLGMRTFRHKTKHWYFVIGMPLIFILQAVLILWIGGKFFR